MYNNAVSKGGSTGKPLVKLRKKITSLLHHTDIVIVHK